MRLGKATVAVTVSVYVTFAVWLVSSFLDFGEESPAIRASSAILFLSLFLASKILQTEISTSKHRFAVNLLQSLTGFFLAAGVFLWLGGVWSSLPQQLAGLTLVMLFAGVFYAAVATIVAGLAKPPMPRLTGKPVLLGTVPLYIHGKLAITVDQPTIAEKVHYEGRGYGYVCHGKASLTAETQFGAIARSLHGFFIIMITPSADDVQSKDSVEAGSGDAKGLGYNELGDFVERARRMLEENQHELRKWFEAVSRGLPPFFTFEKASDRTRLHVAPLVDLEQTPDTYRIKVGPFTLEGSPEAEELRFSRLKLTSAERSAPLVQTYGDCYVKQQGDEAMHLTARGKTLSIISETFSLLIEEDSARLERHGHSVAYSLGRRRLVAPEFTAETSGEGWARLQYGETSVTTSGNTLEVRRGDAVERVEHSGVARRIYDVISETVDEGATRIAAGRTIDSTTIMHSLEYFLELTSEVQR